MPLSELLAVHDGLVRTPQLRALAADRAELRRLTRALHRVLHGVYAERGNDDPLLVHRAALLLLPGLVFRAETALLLHGVPFVDEPPLPQVYVDQRCDASDRPELDVARATFATLTRLDVQGLPVVTPARAAIDLASSLSRADGLALLDSVLRTGLETPDSLAGELRSGARGVVQARELLALADGRAESPPESWVRLLLHNAHLPAPIPQYEVVDRWGRFVARIDLAWPQWRLALEYDGRQAHEGDLAFVRDRRRQNDLLALGWVCLRITSEDLKHPWELVRRVREQIALLSAA